MSAESVIHTAGAWDQEYRVLADDGTAYDGTSATVSASCKVNGASFTVTAGWVIPTTDGVALISMTAAVAATLPAPAVGEVTVLVTQAGKTQAVGVFTIHTRIGGAAAVAIPEPVP